MEPKLCGNRLETGTYELKLRKSGGKRVEEDGKN